MKNKISQTIRCMALAGCLSVGIVRAEENDRLQTLEKQMAAANAEIAALKGENQDLSGFEEAKSKFTLGGYGEIHAKFEENGPSELDVHRLVLYFGYEFSDWIKLNTELEIEHAFVSSGNSVSSYIALEQIYVDFLFNDSVNARVGFVLAPVGIINEDHEPTLFLGVERPQVDVRIIPTTWTLGGAGIYGSPLSWLSYKAYVVGGLDGSNFTAESGPRGGRIRERPGLNDPAISGRIDLFPFEEQDIRFGLSGYYGGTDNSNQGGRSGAKNNFGLGSADFEYYGSRVRVRGVIAYSKNSNPTALGAPGENVGAASLGWYLEGGVSVMPKSWKKGRLSKSDIIPFVRYEEYDTQYKVAAGTVKDEANDRTDITLGVNFPLTEAFVLKADYQLKYNEAASNPNNVFNLGMGWIFN